MPGILLLPGGSGHEMRRLISPQTAASVGSSLFLFGPLCPRPQADTNNEYIALEDLGAGFNFFVLIFFSPSFVCFHDLGSPFPCPKLQEVCNPLNLLAPLPRPL